MSRRSIAVLSLFMASLSLGAELKQETLDAWDRYLQTASARMLEHAAGSRFLWANESPERLNRIRGGEVMVSPVGRTPEAVPSGLVHHWIGAAFIPGARVDEVVTVVRDYDHYTDFYRPSVVDARTLSRKAEEDRFNIVVVDKAMFMKRALDSEYQSRFTQVDSRKWYSIAQTTRVQEIADTRRIPDGEGSGYIWRLCTMTRYEERDGGVYIETEALALSRPIPGALHWMVDPIVRRVSRSSLTMSLEQTREATGAAVKSASAFSGRLRSKRDATNE